MPPSLSLRRYVAGLCALAALLLSSYTVCAQVTGPQQLLFAGLRASSSPNTFYAQFNAVQSDASGNLYLLLDQHDGVRVLKTDPTASTVLAQAQLGAAGDVGLAMALDPAGNVYITGTTTSGALATSSAAAFPSPAGTSTNSFIGKFDQNLNPIFLTYAGSSRTAASAIAATANAVYISGSIFSSTLPVTPSAIIQAPAFGSLQNGFVEAFNTSGTGLLYATYLSGQSLNGAANTAPAAIAADSSGNTYIAGYTTSSGYPTLNALVPNIIPNTAGTTSGFLTKLTPAADGILFSTFIPGAGITSIALAPSPQDPATQTLLLSGSIALGQFPVATVLAPIASATSYQTLLRISIDGSSVLSSTLLAPGTQSTLTPSPDGAVWITGTLTTPASLLPLTSLSTIGNSYGLRVTQQNTTQPQIDQAIRFGGLPSTNPNFASLPVTLTAVTADPTGQPIFAGSASPTASANLLATQTYDLPLYNTPTTALPSTVRAVVLPFGTCSGSLCAGSAAYLAKLSPTTAAPSLALSTDNAPNVTLRNLGTVAAINLQLNSPSFALATDCPTTLNPGAECEIALTGSGPGTLTAEASNATTQTINIPATTAVPSPIAFSPKELDFGIATSTSPSTAGTVTVTNLSQQPQTFTSIIASSQFTPYTFSESSSDCPTNGSITSKTLAAGATCHIILSFAASATSTDDGPAQSAWTIGTGNVLLSAYTQAASLSLSANEIDFGTQYGTGANSGLRLPRFLYLSNNSATSITHTPVALAAPFSLADDCPTTLGPHTVCQLQITYNSPIAPSADSTTLTLDQGEAVLITGTTLPPPLATGQSVNPNLTVSPTAITFTDPVLVTNTSATTQSVTITNIGAQPFALSLALTGDFTSTTNCPALLPGNNTACNVLLTFAPSQPGTRNGLLSVTAGSGTSPAYVTLSGTATGILSAPNNTLDFGDVILNQPSVQWYKITSSFAALIASTSVPDFKAILVEDVGFGHGQPSSAAFTSSFTGSCRNCWLGVQFTPTSAGPQTATLTLASTSGSSSPLTLTGTGLPLTGLILAPVTQDFGSIPVHSSSAPTLFTLTNLTSSTVALSMPTVTGDFAITTAASAPTGGPACSGSLAPNASCFLNIVFAPTATGQRTGVLNLPTGSTPVTSALTGFGTPDPGLSLNPAALIFNNVPGPTSTQQTITLTNTGFSTLQIAAPTTATPNFFSTTNCTTLAPAQTCNITVTYTPTTALVTDTLQIPVTSATTGLTTYTVPLSGAYTTENAGLQILPAETNFGPAPTSTLGGTRQFTINNLTSKSLSLNLSLPRQFVLAPDTETDTQTCAALAPNASCTFSVTFLPLTNGDLTGTIFAQATPTDGSATLDGLAYLEGYGNGSATLAITGSFIPNQPALNFGQIASGQTAQQTLTLTNKGAIPLTVRRLTSEWPFLVTSTTCGATLSPNQSCTVTLTYTAVNQTTSTSSPQPTTDTGTLVIESDALSGPDLVDLTGSAAPVSAAPGTAPLVSYAASQSSLTFPAIQAGNSSPPQTVTLANTGTTTIHITTLQTTPDFAYQTNCGTLLPSQSCNINITFTPQPDAANDTSARISALQITSDASTALDFISLLGTATPSPLTLTPLSLNFGSVQVGSTATLPLQITNTSPTPITFNSITTTSGYLTTGDCPTPGTPIAASTSCTLQVAFTPTQTGAIPGTVTVSTSASPTGLIATLTGIGIQSHLQIVPGSLNFGSIAVGASSTQTLTLTNTGTASVTGLNFAIDGDYDITVPCPVTLLAPNTSCQLTVAFTPTALGARNGNLTIASSDSPAPIQVPLTGTGVPNGTFLLTVDGASSATATVPSASPASYTLLLTPQSNYIGTVVLNCTPITAGPNAACSLLPSSIPLNGAPQNAVATINTITTPPVTTASNTLDRVLLGLLPAALLFFRKTRRIRTIFCALLLTAASGCGGSKTQLDILVTPPGTYQYQVTASSTTGVQLTQSVTLNLVVTAR
jgi:trimeric autotransporter adhesin